MELELFVIIFIFMGYFMRYLNDVFLLEIFLINLRVLLFDLVEGKFFLWMIFLEVLINIIMEI